MVSRSHGLNAVELTTHSLVLEMAAEVYLGLGSRVDTNRRIAWFRDLLPYKTAPDRQLRAKLKVVVCARCLGNPRGRRVMRPSCQLKPRTTLCARFVSSQGMIGTPVDASET